MSNCQQIQKYILVVSAFVILAESRPATSYQYVKFITDTSESRRRSLHSIPIKNNNNKNRSSRSFVYPFDFFSDHEFDFWSPEFIIPTTNFIGVEERNGHVTPDFSNGLDYPDPYLLTGQAARLAVAYLYGKGELFFSDFPHIRALMNNQKQRQANGLAGNKLGSLSPQSPFYRYGHQRNFFDDK